MKMSPFPKSVIPVVTWFFCGLLCTAQADVLSVPGSSSMFSDGCTVGVASGHVTTDGRPILWKVRDWRGRQQLVYVPSCPYDYVGIRSEEEGVQGGGLNSAGVATGNSLIGSGNNTAAMDYILENNTSFGQIREAWQSAVKARQCSASGCFPFIDANGNAAVFEVSLSDWLGDYDSMDPDRQAQGLYGFVVRANEFHRRSDGTDDQTIRGGRYESGTYNMAGLIGTHNLSVQTLIQGDEGPNKGYEFVRYGPGRPLATITRDNNVSTMVVHGVAPGEDPALATLWVILGQSNYGIAVPVWVRVSDIPQSLATGEMYDCITSLLSKRNEVATQASIFPAEAHLFDVVMNRLLPHWRTYGIASVAEMTRIEHQIADDAYTLLDCLNRRQNNNMAPTVALVATKNARTLTCSVNAQDSDGRIIETLWDFGDGVYSTEGAPVHAYAEPGTYLVSCTVTDDDGVSITDWAYCLVP